jgi:hypothetical protein
MLSISFGDEQVGVEGHQLVEPADQRQMTCARVDQKAESSRAGITVVIIRRRGPVAA